MSEAKHNMEQWVRLLNMPSYRSPEAQAAIERVKQYWQEETGKALRIFDMSNELNRAATPEPAPSTNRHPHVSDMAAAFIAENYINYRSYREVLADLMERKEFGMRKYGTALQPFNGRDTLNDLYQELLDGINYVTQALFEARYNNYAASEVNELNGIRGNLANSLMACKNLINKQNLRKQTENEGKSP